jgi:signal transduction histidine kinase
MPKFSLYELLRTRRAAIIDRWQRRVQETLGAEDLSRAELVDSMPAFLKELTVALGPRTDGALPDESDAAPAHGSQRYRTGFDVGEVIREYGLLGDVMLELVADMDETLALGEVRVLLTSLHTGAAEAVLEYVRRRDDEARQQNARHLGFVAHELRSPLGAASTALDIVRRTLEHAPARAVQLLDRSLSRLRELIDHVLVAGKLEAGVEPQYGPVAVDDLVRTVEADALPQAEDRGMTLEVEVQDGLVVEGDTRLLLSAVGNLVRNAVKFSKPGGIVRIRARSTDDVVAVEVEDSCGGLPDGTAAELFEPFVQRGADRSGLGLGLAIVRQAVEAHGGQVDVRNLPGRGCVFSARLPISRRVGGRKDQAPAL